MMADTLFNIDFFIKLLLAIYTPTISKKSTNRLLRDISNHFKKQKDIEVNYYSSNDFSSIFMVNKKFSKNVKVILNGHIDVLPAQNSSTTLMEDKDFYYGRGVLDMKGGVAVALAIFSKYHDKFPIAVQLVSDEEIGGFDCTLHQLNKGIKADFVIIPEPTNLDIENQAKGIIWVEGLIKGKAAHAAYPWLSINPYFLFSKIFTNEFLKHTNPNETTISLTYLNMDSHAFNEIPEILKFKLDIRYPYKNRRKIKKLLKDFKAQINNNGFLKIVLDEPPFYVSPKNTYLSTLLTELKKIKPNAKIKMGMGSSDARHFMRFKIPAIEFGPSGSGMGESIEKVSKKSLEKLYIILESFFKRVF